LYFAMCIVQNQISTTQILLPHYMQFYIHIRGTWCNNLFGPKLISISEFQ
jgi:hypothetical protein